MRMYNRKLDFRLEKEVLDRIEAFCRAEKIKKAQLVRRVLDQWLDMQVTKKETSH